MLYQKQKMFENQRYIGKIWGTLVDCFGLEKMAFIKVIRLPVKQTSKVTWVVLAIYGSAQNIQITRKLMHGNGGSVNWNWKTFIWRSLGRCHGVPQHYLYSPQILWGSMVSVWTQHKCVVNKGVVAVPKNYLIIGRLTAYIQGLSF